MALVDDIIDISISASMKGSYSATIKLANATQQYSPKLIHTPIDLFINAKGTVSNVSNSSSLFGSGPRVYGIVSRVETTDTLSEKTTTLTVKSFHSWLAKKPVNLGKLNAKTSAYVFTYLYGVQGVPLELTSYPLVSDTLLTATVEGNNTLEELRRISQAFGLDLYVDYAGILTASVWKNASSSIDLEIPNEAIKNVTRVASEHDGPSKVTVRGCFVSGFDKGEQTMADDEYEVRNDVPVDKTIPLKSRDVQGTSTDVRNAKLEMEDSSVVERKTGKNDGRLDTRVRKSGGGYYGKGTQTTKRKVKGRRRGRDESDNMAGRNVAGRDAKPGGDAGLQEVAREFGISTPASGGPAGGAGVRNGAGNRATDKTADAMNSVQLEMYGVEPSLVAEVGLNAEQIENRYLSTDAQMIRVCLRRFQEYLMERNAWSLDLTFLPGLELNQVVKFRTPYTSPGGVRSVTGVVTDIQVKYSPGKPECSMTAVVAGLGELGELAVDSGNILQDPEIDGTEGLSEWAQGSSQTSAASLDFLHSQPVKLKAPDTETVQLQLDLTLPEPNVQYLLSFQQEQITATANTLTVEVKQGASLVTSKTISASDSEQQYIVFTPTDVDVDVFWTSLGSGSESSWKIWNPRLSVTVMG